MGNARRGWVIFSALNHTVPCPQSAEIPALAENERDLMMDERYVREIGEFGLIEHLFAALPPEARAATGLEIGIGDDAAVWLPPAGERIVVTTDSLIEDVHFRLDWTDWESL